MKLDLAKTELGRICQDVTTKLQTKTYVVGGFVRDSILGLDSKDIDLEVYGLSLEEIQKRLAGSYQLDLVDQSFGVLKVKGFPIDISIPRRERLTGIKHKDFSVTVDPTMTEEEACARRDFTIGALLCEVSTGKIFDFYRGLEHLESKILEPTSDRFSEDPLRVLRAAQFIARFELTPSQKLIEVCRQIPFEGISKERIEEELKKLLLKGTKIGDALRFLKEVGWLFPELQTLVGCRQDVKHHPEGDAFEHTCLCMDDFAKHRTGDEDWLVGLAVLCHDLGKPLVTEEKEGRIISYGHEEAGVEPTKSMLARFLFQEDLIEKICVLVADHMHPVLLHKSKSSSSAVRRLARRVGRLDLLIRVFESDKRGRRIDDPDLSASTWLLDKAKSLEVLSEPPKQLILGRVVLGLAETEPELFGHFQPGKELGDFLKSCFEDQLEGKFDKDSIMEFLHEKVKTWKV